MTTEAELRMTLGSTSIKGMLADFRDTIHLSIIPTSDYYIFTNSAR
ncbi:DUF3898 domain-containing protein [Bacillus paranthracis]|nr:DUF3898 domain-containing protein [Bacillus paranthracis]